MKHLRNYKQTGFILLGIFLLTAAWLLFRTKPERESGKKAFVSYPSEWFFLQRTFPHGKADSDVYHQAIRSVKRQRMLARKSRIATWQFAGPGNIGGRIADIEFDPRRPDIVYAGAATGGVFKSTDGGQTWHPIFDAQAVLTVGDIAVDPQNSDVIYVGTGEANGGHNNFPGGGIYKSIDGGLSWKFIGLEASTSIARIRIDPERTNRIFVAAAGSYFSPNPERGIYMSENGGKTWHKSLFVSDSTGAIDLVMDPANPDHLMAAMWERVRRPVDLDKTHLYGATSGIYRTENGGKNWQRLGPSNGLPDGSSERIGRIGLSLHHADGRTVYALYTDGFNISGLYRSDDFGNQWRKRDESRQLREGDAGFSWYFGQVRVHPDNPDRVFVLDVALMRSLDGGDSWPIRYGYGGYNNLHVDHHALAFHPDNPDIILDGNDGGINISKDGGRNWTKIKSLPVTQFYEIGLDARNPQRLYGGTQDNGTIRTVTGSSDDWETILGADGFHVLVDPSDPQTIYMEYQFGNLFKSTDGGKTRAFAITEEMSEEQSNWSTPVAMDRNHSDTLYYGTYRLWRTEDATQTWQPVSPNLTRQLENSRVGTITAIAVAPSDPDVIYAGTDDGLVWVSQNYGQNWQNVSDSLPFRWVTRIAVNPLDAATAYVTFSGLKWRDPQPHIFKTSNAGRSWRDISGNLPDAPVNTIVVDPLHPEQLYIGNDVGAFVSFNGGKSWELLGEGLPTVVVSDMEVHEANRMLVAGTYGRSMYTLDLTAFTGVDRSPTNRRLPTTVKLHNNYPNPFNNQTQIHIDLNKKMPVRLRVFNNRGQFVRTLADGVFSDGNHTFTWDGRDKSGRPVASGVYYLVMRAGSEKTALHKSKKLVLLK